MVHYYLSCLRTKTMFKTVFVIAITNMMGDGTEIFFDNVSIEKYDESSADFFDHLDSDFVLPKKQIDDFKTKYNLVQDMELSLQRVSLKNEVLFGGKLYPVNQMKTVKIFTDDASYMHDGRSGRLPRTNVLQMEDDEDIVTAETYPNGEIKSVMIVKKKDGQAVELVSISPGILVTIQSEDYDKAGLNSSFRYGEMKGRRNDQILVRSHENEVEKDGAEGMNCLSYEEIELAVAYESSFCANSGGSRKSSDESVVSIVAKVSSRYQQNNVCKKVVISHLEGYCKKDKDPYKGFVALNLSGCDSYGLLVGFQDYWNNNRRKIKRDTAQLFSGTGLECDGSGCTIGCANIGVTCVKDVAYGVNYVTYSGSERLRSTLVAHEIGHNNGADHLDNEEYIMNPLVTDANRGFSWRSINKFNTHFRNHKCLTVTHEDSNDMWVDLLIRAVVFVVDLGGQFVMSFWNAWW